MVIQELWFSFWFGKIKTEKQRSLIIPNASNQREIDIQFSAVSFCLGSERAQTKQICESHKLSEESKRNVTWEWRALQRVSWRALRRLNSRTVGLCAGLVPVWREFYPTGWGAIALGDGRVLSDNLRNQQACSLPTVGVNYFFFFLIWQTWPCQEPST